MLLTLGKEHRLRMFENKVQRIIFGPQQSHGITKDELHNLYSTLNCQKCMQICFCPSFAAESSIKLHVTRCAVVRNSTFHVLVYCAARIA